MNETMVSPQQLQAALPLDAFDRPHGQVPFRVRHRDQARLGRVGKMPVAAGGPLVLPPVCLKGLDDRATVHVCVRLHTIPRGVNSSVWRRS